MRQFQIDDTCVPPVYRPLLLDKTRYIVLYGGRGSGKSKFAFRKFVLRCFKNEFFRCVYCIKEYSAIRDSIFAGLKEAIDDLGLSEYFKCYDSDYRIKCINGNIFLPMGVDEGKDKIEKLKGKEEVSHLLIDEVNKLTRDEFFTLNELLRTAKTDLQTCIMFNPVLETHWLRAEFFSEEDSHAPNPNYGEQLIVLRTTLWNNNFINREQYHADLLKAASGNLNRIKVNVDGDWGQEENKNPWLYNFDEDKHVREDLPFIYAYPVHLIFDFNRQPMSCLVAQMSPNKADKNSFVHFINEFSSNVQLKELCDQIKNTYPKSILFVTGDASGSSGDIGFENRNDSYYKMIQSYLKLNNKQLHLITKNMEHNDSRNLCNTMLCNLPNVLISRKCKVLIDDCYKATIDDTKLKAGVLKKDRDLYKMDMFDAFRYFWQCYFKEYAQIAGLLHSE